MAVFVVHLQKLLRKYPHCVLSGAVLLFLTSLLLPPNSQSQELPEIRKYIHNGGYALNKNGTTLFSQDLKTTFIPASTLKILTSLAALEILGPDHFFTTSVYLDSRNTLYIQGSGDPFLVSEKVRKITELIAEKGISKINNIVLDDSAFALEHLSTEGSENSTNPYDTNCGALGINFNTLPLQVLHKAKVKSPETQTPYLPIMGQIGQDLSSGYHRVNVDAFPAQKSLSNSLLYCGQLFKTLLQGQGITVKGTIRHGRVPQDLSLLLKYTAKETVRDLVQSCLLSSNNFMANQLYLAVGVAQYGYPATWKKSKLAMASFIHNSLQLTDKQITMVEGSGLSKKNRISPEAMLLILEKFKPYASLLPIKYGLSMKSGTLLDSGVFCYAGYTPQGSVQSPFVILLNQKENGRDTILKFLYQQSVALPLTRRTTL